MLESGERLSAMIITMVILIITAALMINTLKCQHISFSSYEVDSVISPFFR